MSTANGPERAGYTASELMIVTAARALAGVRTVFVGVGLPGLACTLAQHTVAPELELIYESGVYGAQPERQPLNPDGRQHVAQSAALRRRGFRYRGIGR